MSETTSSNGALPVRSMDEILAELDQRGQPERHEVKVPEWGAVFYVRGLTRAEVLHIDRISTNRKGIVDKGAQDLETLLIGVVEPTAPRRCEPDYQPLAGQDCGVNHRREGRRSGRRGGGRGRRRHLSG
jgi:hypothetical protein